MSGPTNCPHAHDDAAYVLGSLSPAERLEFERHLAGCKECTRSVRELAGLPGLLSRIDPAVLEESAEPEPLPDTLLPALLGEVRRTRRRRTTVTWLLAAAAVALIAVLGAVVVVGGGPARETAAPPSGAVIEETMQPVGDVPVRGHLTLEQVGWGTKLGLACTYDPESVEYDVPPEVDYLLVVQTRDGRTERVGSWRSTNGRTATLSAATAVDRDEIASVEVRTPDGRVVLRADS